MGHMGTRKTMHIPAGRTAARGLCGTPEAGGCGCGCRLGEGGGGLPCPEPRCPLDCSDQGRCRAGRCHCFAGFTGPSCATPACPPGRGGPHCTLGTSPGVPICPQASPLPPSFLIQTPPPQPCWVLIPHISVSPSISCCSIMLTLCPHPSALGCPPQSALGSSVLLVSLPAPPQSSPLLWVSPWPWGCPLSQCPHGLGTLVPWALLPRPCGCPHPLGALSCGIPRVSPLHGCPNPRCPLVVPNLWLPHPGVPQSIPVVAPPKRAVSLQRSPQ